MNKLRGRSENVSERLARKREGVGEYRSDISSASTEVDSEYDLLLGIHDQQLPGNLDTNEDFKDISRDWKPVKIRAHKYLGQEQTLQRCSEVSPK